MTRQPAERSRGARYRGVRLDGGWKVTVCGVVVCASPSAELPTVGGDAGDAAARLSRGRPEKPFFLENAARWATALRDADADVVMTDRPGTHGGDFWRQEFR